MEEAFREHASYVAAVALRLLGRDEEVDDVVQDTFLRAMSGLGRLRDPAAVRGWLATVAVRVARRKLRARRLFAFVGLDGADNSIELCAPGAGPEEKALLHKVYGLLEKLPVDERIAWTLRHVEGEPLERVAELCGCSLATAKRRIARAHATLEERLDD